jgi:hypothetical protein
MQREIIALFLSQAVFIAIFLFVFRKRVNEGTYMISIIVLAIAPFTFIFGLFFGSFNTNLCYSGVLETFVSIVEETIKSNDSSKSDILLSGINSIPNHGYESECSKISESLTQLSAKIKPIKGVGQ